MLWQTERQIYAFRTSEYRTMQTCLLDATNTNKNFGNQKNKITRLGQPPKTSGSKINWIHFL